MKGKLGCFPNWHEIQSKLSLDIEPNKLLEANCCTQEEDVWPRRECQSAREGKEETAAAAATTEKEQLMEDEGCPWETYAQL